MPLSDKKRPGLAQFLNNKLIQLNEYVPQAESRRLKQHLPIGTDWHQNQCDQIGRFISLTATFQSLWQQFICPHFRQFL